MTPERDPLPQSRDPSPKGGRRVPGDLGSWRRFAALRRRRRIRPLRGLARFREPILVGGCQRSGTTMVAETLRAAPGAAQFPWSEHTELDGAQVLAELVETPARGRFVFQTTYVNTVADYLESETTAYRLIWMVRRPEAVVFSMARNWARWALNELLRDTGLPRLAPAHRRRYRWLGAWALSPLLRARACYSGKTGQVEELYRVLGPERLRVVDYDRLVRRPEILLPELFEFAGLVYAPHLAERLHRDSLALWSVLAPETLAEISRDCSSTYARARELA